MCTEVQGGLKAGTEGTAPHLPFLSSSAGTGERRDSKLLLFLASLHFWVCLYISVAVHVGGLGRGVCGWCPHMYFPMGRGR